MRPQLLVAAAILFAAAPAAATPARVAGLAANPGFVDETDFFAYPSALSAAGRNAWVNYNGGFDAGLSWDDQALWIDRDTLANDVLGLGPQGGWRASYFKSQGETGWNARGSVDSTTETVTLGGSWGSGTRNPSAIQEMGFGADIALVGGFEDPNLGLDVFGQGRTLTDDSLRHWALGAAYQDEVITVAGIYHMGPRFTVVENVEVALALGPGLVLAIDNGDLLADAFIPLSNAAVEYQLRPWLELRAAATAGLVATYDGSDLNFDSAMGGAMGVGLKHEHLDVDLTVNPNWTLGGPFFLSGVPQPLSGVISIRTDI